MPSRIYAENRLVVQDYLIQDSFTDSGELEDHAPDRDSLHGGWNEVVGDWEIVFNKASVTSAVFQNEFAMIDSGKRNVCIQADLTYGAGCNVTGIFGICGAGDLDHNCLGLYYIKDYGYLGIGIIDGAGTFAEYSWNVGETKKMMLVIEDNLVAGYINGEKKVARAMADYPTNTLVGLVQKNCDSNLWDNFRVSQGKLPTPSRSIRVGASYAVGRLAVQSAVWSPLDIADCELWLDVSQIVGLNDGDDVSAWDDLSGNSRHATQAIALDKPHFREAYRNGLAAVEFDGANHWMDLDLSSAIALADHTIIVACETRDTATTADQRFLYVNVAGDEFSLNSVTATAGKLGWFDGAWENAANATDAAQVLSFQLAAAGAEVFRDGVSIGDSLGLVAHQLADDAALCANTAGNYLFDGYLFEFLIYSPILNATDRAKVEAYLIAKWGI